MHIYRVTLTLAEPTFYATRELGRAYLTEPYLHNYALAYAFGLAVSRYHDDEHVPRYEQELAPLNRLGAYLTPARAVRADFVVNTFKFANIAYHVEMKQSSVNVPTFGRARELAPESVLVAYLISREPVADLYARLDRPQPNWVRLGKWLSKAAVGWEPLTYSERIQSYTVGHPLNPLDLPSLPSLCDMVHMPPVSLVTSARLEGKHYQIVDRLHGDLALPMGLSYQFPAAEAAPSRRG